MNEKVQQTETGNALQRFLKRKNIIFSAKRYGIDALGAIDRKSTRLNSSHWNKSRMPSSA